MRAALRSCALLSIAVLLTACTTTSALNTSPFQIPSERYAALVTTVNGKVLHETRADAIRFPASLTKMMTMYMAFEALNAGKISKSTPVPISSYAASRSPSKLYLKAGETITVDTALEALSVKSANDVAAAMAEFLGGSEDNFARLMTAKARSLGMSSTTFRNASGLPDPRQVTTARDMGKLGIALYQRHRRHFHYFSRTSMTFRGRTIRGHNKVLGMLRGADGIKTGYTRASGFNLVTSAQTSKGRVIGVILGENSSRSRDQHMVELINAFGR